MNKSWIIVSSIVHRMFLTKCLKIRHIWKFIATILDFSFFSFAKIQFLVDTGRKLNVRKTFRKRPERLLNVLCTLNLRPVSKGLLKVEIWSSQLI